jgi:1,2-diacylglycerol 3-alpha-glucosyltransferase
LVKELNIESNVHFAGFLNHCELNEQVAKSVALLIATHKDLNMVSIPEAIVSGTPVLSNTVPALSAYIVKNNLGICKDNWGIRELELMIEEQQKFVDNCIRKRDDLSSENSAKKMIEAYQRFDQNELGMFNQ